MDMRKETVIAFLDSIIISFEIIDTKYDNYVDLVKSGSDFTIKINDSIIKFCYDKNKYKMFKNDIQINYITFTLFSCSKFINYMMKYYKLILEHTINIKKFKIFIDQLHLAIGNIVSIRNAYVYSLSEYISLDTIIKNKLSFLLSINVYDIYIYFMNDKNIYLSKNKIELPKYSIECINLFKIMDTI